MTAPSPSVLFGNAQADYWRLWLEDVAVDEGIVALDGELSVGFFDARTPMCIDPETLKRFLAELRELDRTLVGTVTLESSSIQSALNLQLRIGRRGEVLADARFEVGGNALTFSIETDQTRLGPLADWLQHIIDAYETSPGEPR